MGVVYAVSCYYNTRKNVLFTVLCYVVYLLKLEMIGKQWTRILAVTAAVLIIWTGNSNGERICMCVAG